MPAFGPPATYSPADITIVFNGVVLTNYAEDSFITIERASPLFIKKMGADGQGARAKVADKSASIKVKLLATSPSNDALSGFVALDEQFGTGFGPLQVTDLNSLTTLYHSDAAWVSELPHPEYGKEVGEREWVLETLNLEMVLSGTPSP